MEELLFLARGNPYSNALASIGYLVVRVMLVALVLNLCRQLITQLPYVQKLVQQNPGKLALMLLMIAVAVLLAWNVPALRILHEMDLIGRAKTFRWPDIIISALAIVRISYIWPEIFSWFGRQTS